VNDDRTPSDPSTSPAGPAWAEGGSAPLATGRGPAALALANALYAAYALDALITLVHVALLDGAAVPVLPELRNVVAVLAVWCSLAWLLTGWAWVPAPPGFLVVPAASALWFHYAGGAPIELLFFDPWEGAALQDVYVAMQTAIAVTMVGGMRLRNGTWHVPATLLDSQRWSVGRHLRRGLAHGGVALAVILPLAPAVMLASVSQMTAGWAWFRADGMYLREQGFVNASGQRVRLVAMMHMGEWRTYETIFSGLDRPGVVVLEEGVTDRTGSPGWAERVPPRRGVARPSEPFGLVSQPSLEQFVTVRRLDEPSAHDSDPVHDPVHGDPVHAVAVRNADVDLSDLSATTRETVRDAWRHLSGGIDAGTWYAIAGIQSPEEERAFLADAVHARNAALLDHLDASIAEFEEVVVPWGALHMPGIVRGLSRWGFRPEGPPRRHRILSWQSRFVGDADGLPLRPLVGYDAAEADAWVVETLERIYADARPGWVFDPVEAAEAAVGARLEPPSPGARFGGLPTRFEGEAWPRNGVTDRPMTFVAEIVRTAENAPFLGRIERLRLFVDWDAFFGDDERQGYALLLDLEGAPPRELAPWTDAELAVLAADFGESDYGGVLHGEARAARGSVLPLASVPYLDAPRGSSLEQIRAFIDRARRLEADYAVRHEDVLDPYERSVIGGRPSWVQYPDPQPLPFFLQLYPDGDLMWQDAGHLYLFLDPLHPERGWILKGQSG
jgi:hypothetical protein